MVLLMPSPEKATESLRRKRSLQIEKRTAKVQKLKVDDQKIAALWGKLGYNRAKPVSPEQIKKLRSWLLFVAEEYERYKETRTHSIIPKFGHVQFSNGECAELLKPLLDIETPLLSHELWLPSDGSLRILSEWDLPMGISSEIGKRMNRGQLTIKQAIRQLYDECKAGAGHDKRVYAKYHAAELMLWFLRMEKIEWRTKQRRNDFIQETLKCLGIKSATDESDFRKFMKVIEG